MTRHEIATLACKILALWAFAEAILTSTGIITSVVFLFSHEPQWPNFFSIVYLCTTPIGMLIIGLILWFRAPGIAARMVSSDPAVVTRADINQESVLSIAFAAIGVFIFVPALNTMVRTVLGFMSGDGNWEFVAPISWIHLIFQPNFWSSIVELGLSIWLIFGSRGIAHFVLWVRSAGPKSGNEETGK
ncbi:MAG TPA: hypothetical protein VMG59_03700 [Phycisphaerae bacterium]|nr:hypothetical protein [Phycisphaerae bacterium]